MALCVGCGLSINNGILEANVCSNGGIGCAGPSFPGPDGCTDGLYIDPCALICPTAGLGCATAAAPGPGGCTRGLYVNAGCGTQLEGDGQFGIKINALSDDDCLLERNLLVCDDVNGLSADHHYDIAGNSLICGTGSTFIEPFGLNLATGQTAQWHTPLLEIAPQCDDLGLCWQGNTVFDIGGIVLRMAPGAFGRVTFDLYQGYAPGPVVFSALNPSYSVAADNRGVAQTREYDISLHDTTWQIICGTQTIQFQLRMTVEAIIGAIDVRQVTLQNWEATWHYSHLVPDPAAIQGSQLLNGCATP